MNYQEFLKHIAGKNFSQCYFFNGPEDYLMEDCTKRLMDLLVDPATKDFNLNVFYGNEADAGKIIDTADAYPMMADSRVVVVKDVDKLSVSHLDALAKYLEKPSPSTRMVLSSTKGDLRKKAMKQIKLRSTYVEFKPLYDNQIPTWIHEFLAEQGLEISHEASLLLHARVGNNLRSLANELDKILLNLQGRKKIEEADVQQIVGLSRNFSVFNLTDAIGNKDLNNALRILNQMLQSGESHTGIVAMITRHFVSLLKIRSAVQLKKSQSEITALTGLPPFLLKKTMPMARNFSFEQFNQIFENLLQTDLSLKSSKLSPDIALQMLLVQIISDKN